MDMRFYCYWMRCLNAQGQFCYYWRPGKVNLADYYTKHHPQPHHVIMRREFLTPQHHLDLLRRRKELAERCMGLAQHIAQSYASLPATRVC